MKRYSDGFQEGSKVEKGHPAEKLNLKTSPTQNGVVNIQGQVEMLGDFSRNMVGKSNSPKHSGAVLRTEGGRVIVYLGPAWYFCQNDFPIRAGDILEISGSTLFMSAHQPIILAKEVRTKRKRLKIRDDQGRPLWSIRK